MRDARDLVVYAAPLGVRTRVGAQQIDIAVGNTGWSEIFEEIRA